MTHESRRPEEESPPIPGLQGLDLQVQPERDLWPGIETRLAPRRPLQRSGWIGYAAAAGIVLSVGVGLWRQVPDPGAAVLPGPTAALPQASSATLMAYAPRENHALVKAHLKIVRDAEKQLRYALERDPESESLQRLLASMQSQRRDLQRLSAQDT